ncbi:uncharacterized protein LOC115632713 [Scaptodrosophila lebanonensis]|uniref:Uncharacterized protein LOC115632713 n=1 Tax=Drosophila lebanonensis TaxID=7225 RepID=A0A6J2UCK8_DROLE|nr:uncharacterized protein LOC115632713 [Scaptodrosophila lebanonensis]
MGSNMLENAQRSVGMLTSTRLDAPAVQAAAAQAVAAERESVCDANANANINATKSPTRKEKTILNWLVKSASASASANTSASNENNNRVSRVYNNYSSDNYNNQRNHNCTCEREQTRALFKQRADSGLRDFRGVQTLRHLWNKRISASIEQADAPSRGPIGTLRKLNKSVSCLVNAFNNARESPAAVETHAKRTLSLHDCTQIEAYERNVGDLNREKDNFYKYKNAEQAKMRNKLRRSSAAGAPRERGHSIEDTLHFPVVKAASGGGGGGGGGGSSVGGERLQWPKRQDVIGQQQCITKR